MSEANARGKDRYFLSAWNLTIPQSPQLKALIFSQYKKALTRRDAALERRLVWRAGSISNTA